MKWTKILAVAPMLLAPALTGAQAEPEAVVHPLSFSQPAVLPGSGDASSVPAEGTCNTGCAEPAFATAPDGTIYVTAPRGLLICCNARPSPLWRSADGGRTWSAPFAPTSPEGAFNAFTGGDTAMMVDRRGTLFISELWLGNDSLWVSRDRGETWSSTPAHHPEALVDREWLAYSRADDMMYGIYNSWLGKSFLRAKLGGDTDPLVWTDWTPGAILHNGSVPVLSVDQQTGTIYIPVRSSNLDTAVGVAVSTDEGRTWIYRGVPGSGTPSTDVQNIFLVSAVDSAGTAYVAWSATESRGHTVYVAASTDEGRTWTGPHAVSRELSKTAVFPALAAGARGRVVVGWYGTNDATGAAPDHFPSTTRWHVAVATGVGIDGSKPTFDRAIVQDRHHIGSMWMAEQLTDPGNRRLLDFFDVEVDPSSGAALVVYARDKGNLVEIAAARQTDGCNLLRPGEYIGPGTPTPPGTPPTVC